jgi:hypothetical protein
MRSLAKSILKCLPLLNTSKETAALEVSGSSGWDLVFSLLQPLFLRYHATTLTYHFFTLFHAAVNSYVKESTQKIEKVEIGRSVTYRVVGGDLRDMYDPYRVTFSFFPVEGKEEEKCIAEWKADYELLNSSMPPPDKARDAALGFLKSFDKLEPSY